jgi:hypothetical protein
MKAANYFGVGAERPKLWLSPENWCDRVPDNLNDKEAEQIANALRDKRIVLGKEWIPPLDKDEKVLEKYLNHLDSCIRADDKFKDPLKSLMLYKKEGNYTALEIYRAMLAREKTKRNRPDVLQFLDEACNHYIGPVSLVEDYPDDPDNYKVTIDQSTMRVVDSTKKDRKPEDFGELKGLDDPKERAERIGNALN